MFTRWLQSLWCKVIYLNSDVFPKLQQSVLFWIRVDWDTEEESKGHMSCCTLQELTEKVPFVPEIIGDYADDTDLLDGGGSGGPGM